MAISISTHYISNLHITRMLRCCALCSQFYFFTLYPVFSQENIVDYPKEWTVLFGVGAATASDIGTRHLSQEIGGYDTYRYRVGVSASVNYAWHKRWSTTLEWNRGGSVVKWDVFSSKKTKAISTVIHAFSLVFERRFAFRKDQYFYSGLGLGVYNVAKEKTLVYDAPTFNARFSRFPVPLFKPIGMCFGVGRVKGYLETGLFTLPILSGGIKVRL
jgi:hypothetical protein